MPDTAQRAPPGIGTGGVYWGSVKTRLACSPLMVETPSAWPAGGTWRGMLLPVE